MRLMDADASCSSNQFKAVAVTFKAGVCVAFVFVFDLGGDASGVDKLRSMFFRRSGTSSPMSVRV